MGKTQTEENIRLLVGSLEDPDSNIRWLAGSTLVKFADELVVEMLATFLDQGPNDDGRKESMRVLGLIAETAEDKEVQKLAKEIVNAVP